MKTMCRLPDNLPTKPIRGGSCARCLVKMFDGKFLVIIIAIYICTVGLIFSNSPICTLEYRYIIIGYRLGSWLGLVSLSNSVVFPRFQ